LLRSPPSTALQEKGLPARLDFPERTVKLFGGRGMPIRVSLSQSDGDLIVRLPTEVSFPPQVREVIVERQGAGYVVTPVDLAWDDFCEAPGCDFPDRDQPLDQRRESFDGTHGEESRRDEGAKPPSA
jgi:antitoxin VapB